MTDAVNGRPASAAGLRRFARPSGPPFARTGGGADERCELCGEQLASEHAHMVDLTQRSLACACTACALLFTRPGGRYQTVPDRVGHDPQDPLTPPEWAELQIPVSTAFFFVNSALGQVIASYPSPAGVTECELDLAAWDRLSAVHPLLRAPVPDVEAILVTGGGPRQAGDIETFLVPIDVCYSLAGALRREWHGFDGGTEVRRIMADLLAGLRQRARTLTPARAAQATQATQTAPGPRTMTETTGTEG
jgi:hypothetical protein